MINVITVITPQNIRIGNGYGHLSWTLMCYYCFRTLVTPHLMLTPQIPPSSSPVACQVLTSLVLVAAPRHHIQTPNSRAHSIRNSRGALREQITYFAHFALLRSSQKLLCASLPRLGHRNEILRRFLSLVFLAASRLAGGGLAGARGRRPLQPRESAGGEAGLQPDMRIQVLHCPACAEVREILRNPLQRLPRREALRRPGRLLHGPRPLRRRPQQ